MQDQNVLENDYKQNEKNDVKLKIKDYFNKDRNVLEND